MALSQEILEYRLDDIEDPQRFDNIDKEEWEIAKESIKEMPPWMEVCFSGSCFDREDLLVHLNVS